jgi:hypothetical protein
MKAKRIGKGCGKRGMNDKPRTMLVNVKEKVITLSLLGSSAR